MPGKCIRGTVLAINLEPVVGHEQQGTARCVVVQNDIGNARSPVTIVVAVTDAGHIQKLSPIHVAVQKGDGGLTKDSVVLCNQIKTVDERRFGKVYGVLSQGTMKKIDQALRVSLDLLD